ncbi:MAG TPA: hypothetical protein VGX26_03840 [Solirubrobacteraceae bacterium]|jgi:hypothetical protein|nr:hypothetical protein [Solirubrobacteraceae bacterium]
MVRTSSNDGTQQRLTLSEHGRGSPAGLPRRQSLADQLIAERHAEERARSKPQPFGTPFPSAETAPGCGDDLV